jgi:predicted ATPase
MQRIEVENFGPLRNVNLEIKDYMVFIGPQASGKSTLAKLIYFFWKVEDKFNQEILSTLVLNKALKTHQAEISYLENWKRDIRKLFSDIFPTYRTGKVKYTYSKDYQITFDVVSYSEKLSDDILVSSGFENELLKVDQRIENSTSLTELRSQKKYPIDDLLEIFAREFLSESSGDAENLRNLQRVFIPAGRGVLSLFSNSFVLVDTNSLDYFNGNFVSFTNTIRKFLESSEYENFFGRMSRISDDGSGKDVYPLANKLSVDILKGDFQTGSKGDAIMHYYNGFGYLVPLKHTSSGQQEATWVINCIQYLLYESQENRFDIIIEEPEAHLFPDTQRAITKLITLLRSGESNKNRVIVTTHSPYVLATLNNSIKAFSVSQLENKSDEVERILDKNFWINPKNLFVGYMTETDERYDVENIFDKELGLIDHEILDKVSDDIMKQFDDLLEIEYSND